MKDIESKTLKKSSKKKSQNLTLKPLFSIYYAIGGGKTSKITIYNTSKIILI